MSVKKFEKRNQIDCVIRLYTSENAMSRDARYDLSNLVYENSHGMTDDVKSVVSKEDYVFVLCAFNAYGNVCGYASVEDVENDLDLKELFVSLNDRQKGYGRRLIQAVRDCAIKMKKNFVNLLVTSENKNAQKVYEDNNFSYLSTSPYGDYFMQIPAHDSVLYQGKLLLEIAKKYGAEHISEGFDREIKKQELLSCIEDFNEKSKDDPIDVKIMKGACVLLEEFIASGRERKQFKTFLREKLNQPAKEGEQSLAEELALESAEQISTAIKYAEQYLVMENSENIKAEGAQKSAKKMKR